MDNISEDKTYQQPPTENVECPAPHKKLRKLTVAYIAVFAVAFCAIVITIAFLVASSDIFLKVSLIFVTPAILAAALIMALIDIIKNVKQNVTKKNILMTLCIVALSLIVGYYVTLIILAMVSEVLSVLLMAWLYVFVQFM